MLDLTDYVHKDNRLNGSKFLAAQLIRFVNHFRYYMNRSFLLLRMIFQSFLYIIVRKILLNIQHISQWHVLCCCTSQILSFWCFPSITLYLSICPLNVTIHTELFRYSISYYIFAVLFSLHLVVCPAHCCFKEIKHQALHAINLSTFPMSDLSCFLSQVSRESIVKRVTLLC